MFKSFFSLLKTSVIVLRVATISITDSWNQVGKRRNIWQIFLSCEKLQTSLFFSF